MDKDRGWSKSLHKVLISNMIFTDRASQKSVRGGWKVRSANTLIDLGLDGTLSKNSIYLEAGWKLTISFRFLTSVVTVVF